MPVPGDARMVGLTITMYAIVKKVVTPAMISVVSGGRSGLGHQSGPDDTRRRGRRGGRRPKAAVMRHLIIAMLTMRGVTSPRSTLSPDATVCRRGSTNSTS